MSNTHISLKEFNVLYPGKTITDYVKYNWLGGEVIPPGPRPKWSFNFSTVADQEAFLNADIYTSESEPGYLYLRNKEQDYDVVIDHINMVGQGSSASRAGMRQLLPETVDSGILNYEVTLKLDDISGSVPDTDILLTIFANDALGKEWCKVSFTKNSVLYWDDNTDYATQYPDGVSYNDGMNLRIEFNLDLEEYKVFINNEHIGKEGTFKRNISALNAIYGFNFAGVSRASSQTSTVLSLWSVNANHIATDIVTDILWSTDTPELNKPLYTDNTITVIHRSGRQTGISTEPGGSNQLSFTPDAYLAGTNEYVVNFDYEGWHYSTTKEITVDVPEPVLPKNAIIDNGVYVDHVFPEIETGSTALGSDITYNGFKFLSADILRVASNYNYGEKTYRNGIRFANKTNMGINIDITGYSKLSLIGRSSSSGSPRTIIINGTNTPYTFHQAGQDVTNAVALTELDLNAIRLTYGNDITLQFNNNADICEIIME